MSGEAVNEITYGASRNEEYDFVDLNEELSSVTARVMQGYWVEFLPWRKLRSVPRSSSKPPLLTLLRGYSEIRSRMGAGSSVQEGRAEVEGPVLVDPKLPVGYRAEGGGTWGVCRSSDSW